LNKLGMTASAGLESRLLSIDILQIIFEWEEQAAESSKEIQVANEQNDDSRWLTPLNLRENMVSYLVRLTTGTHDQPSRVALLPKSFSLLHRIVGPNGWADVTVGLRFFSRALELVGHYLISPVTIH